MSIYKKRESAGPWLKRGEDVNKGDTLEIANEGTKVSGEFGTQDVFLVKTKNGKEGNVGINQTSINNLVDGYGEDSIHWIGKKIKVDVMPQIGKAPAYYFLHPDAELDEATGKFRIPGKADVKDDEIPIIESDGINPKDIPF